MVEIGREKEFIGYRLSDIVFLAEKTMPAKGSSWEDYAKACLRIIAAQAKQAQTYLNVIQSQP